MRPIKSHHSVSDAMRRHRILASSQCVDNRAKLANLKRLIAATDQEYRSMMAELDRLDREGRVWLIVDLIHKTSLATLDLGASLMEVGGLKGGEAVRELSDQTREISDLNGALTDLVSGQASWNEFGRTVLGRAMGRIKPTSAGGVFAKGSADLALSGAENLGEIAKADAASRGTRTIEGGVDGLAGLVQRVADVADADPSNKTRTAKQVSAMAQIARAMVTYNRELEGAFNRRLEISGGLNASRSNFKAVMERTMTRYRRDAAEIERLVQSCM
ncbi:hypothetical protein CX676_10660 [Paracoccus zhejiangensis]|uniref:Uncharacterized protein n=2 Tax=Paracoccus zhejiangensis TaxID=1077935 RepID=A0A2H5EZ48_9RHOB|nr:hypothetical protein CX676_10660 [Paracoccus zhejiangensis]